MTADPTAVPDLGRRELQGGTGVGELLPQVRPDAVSAGRRPGKLGLEPGHAPREPLEAAVLPEQEAVEQAAHLDFSRALPGRAVTPRAIP